MNRFIWLVRREIWEHKAIWIAPLIVLACLAIFSATGNVHLAPIGNMDADTPLADLPRDAQVGLLLLAYGGLSLVVFMVMGIISFFYSLDSLYADRRDRSVLFWKSLPLSDAESVLSKFTVACVVIPLVALAGAVLAQLVIATGGSIKLATMGQAADIMWEPRAIMGGMGLAALCSVTAMLWYAPVVGYLMLASAWAPKGPFLWAVLPPAALFMFERVLLYTNHVGNFIQERLFGLIGLLRPERMDDAEPATREQVRDKVVELSQLDFAANLREFYASADLWLGVVAAVLMIAAATWVRRYRDETA
ncbi:MAG: ABC-2 transporter permease [Gammaproteobacteria bacterium]